MGKTSGSEKSKASAETIRFGKSLLENMAFFADSVWVIDIQKESILVFHDKINPDAVGKEFAIEDVVKLIKAHRHTDETKLIHRLDINYLKSLKKTEHFDDNPFMIKGVWQTLRWAYTPELDEDGNTIRVFVTYTNVQPILDQKTEIDKLKEVNQNLSNEYKSINEKYSNQSSAYSKEIAEILDGSNQHISICREDTYELLYANEAAKKAFNRSGQSCKGYTCHKFFYGLDEPCPMCSIPKLQNGQTEIRSEATDGKNFFDVLLKKTVLHGENVYIEYANNVTAAKQEIKVFQKTLGTLNGTQMGFWNLFLGEGDPILIGDAKMYELIGCAPETDPDTACKIYLERMTAESKEAIKKYIDELSSGKQTEIIYGYNHPDRGLIYIRCGGLRDNSYNGPGIMLRGYHQDVTESQKAIEEANAKVKKALASAEYSAAQSKEFLDIINDIAESGMWYYRYDENGEPLGAAWNDLFRQLLGYSEESDFPQDPQFFWDSIVDEDRPKVKQAVSDAVSGIRQYDVEYRITRKNGEIMWVYARGKRVNHQNGQPRLLIGTLIDITEQKKEDELRLIIQALARDYVSVLLIDDKTGFTQERKRNDVYYLDGIEENTFKDPYDIAWRNYVDTEVHPDDRKEMYEAGKLARVVSELENKSEYNCNYRINTNHGVVHVQFKFMRLNENKIVGAFRSVDEIVHLRESSEMLRIVERDPLTGLYNRQSFFIYAQKLIDENPDTSFDFVCMEIESYRLLTGRYGVENCREFIKGFADTLKYYDNKDTLLGYTDEDQFMAITKHVPFEWHQTFFSGLCESFKTLSKIPNIKMDCGIYAEIDHSLDIAIISNNARMPIDYLREQYEENIALFDGEIRKRMMREQQVKSIAKEGIEKHQFKIFYQPKHDAFTEKVKGAEALVRWIHPELGFISPADFIPVFEKNGFISELDRYIVDAVCSDMRFMLDQGKDVVPISLNVSQVDFDHADLTDFLESIVDSYNIPHNLIHFEVTESANASDIRRKMAAVYSFKEKGFRVELDDFGVGYSSLSTLGELPIDVMKIDMSLISNIKEPKYRTVLNSILLVANGLGISAVAEGVETKEQLEKLRDMCRENVDLLIQGYYYAKPMPLNDFEQYIMDKI